MKVALTVRGLTGKEVRFLRNQRANVVRRRRTLWRRRAAAFIVIFGLLALLTLWAEPRNTKFVVCFWAVLGCAISVPSFIQEWRRLSARIADFDFALGKAQCEDLAVASYRLWEFEEQEDEGACYAFELRCGGVLFISGQDFYPSARFPNADFSIVEVRDRKGAILEMILEKRGEKMLPERRFSAKEKENLRLPEHGAYFDGTLEAVCESLKNA